MNSIRSVSTRETTKYATLQVLLVDDHPHIRSIIIGILSALGIVNVTTAERGETAVEYLSKGKFDLLITDYEMPGMSGTDLARLVRRDARSAKPTVNSRIPILMITGNITRARLTEARDAGIDEILAKPFTVLAVADRFNSAINKRREFVICETYLGPCRRRVTKSDYVGPKRRDSDLNGLPVFEVEQELLLVRQEASSLCKLAQSGDTLGASESDAAVALALTAAQRAKRIRDPLLERACMSLTKYVQWAASSSVVKSIIIETHGQAIIELLELGTRDMRISAQVAQGLEDTVKRAISKRAA